MAATLRTLGQGVKVCFECAVMALDADVIEWGKPVVALGGTASGADTAHCDHAGLFCLHPHDPDSRDSLQARADAGLRVFRKKFINIDPVRTRYRFHEEGFAFRERYKPLMS